MVTALSVVLLLALAVHSNWMTTCIILPLNLRLHEYVRKRNHSYLYKIAKRLIEEETPVIKVVELRIIH